MKTVYSVIFLPFLLILFLVTPVISSNFIEYAKDEDGSVYSYDRHSIIVKVLDRKVVSDKTRNEMINKMKRDGVSVGGYYKLSVIVKDIEINCYTKVCRLSNLYHYDDDGKELFYQRKIDDKWRTIPSDSIIEVLYKEVCKDMKVNLRQR
jgi:hypothetical protein